MLNSNLPENDPLSKLSNPSRIGGFASLRLAYSADIIPPLDKTSVSIPAPVQFKNKRTWLSGWKGFEFQAKLEISQMKTENGPEQNFSFIAAFVTGETKRTINEWFIEKLFGRRLCVELTSLTGSVEIFNQLLVNYAYSAASEFSTGNRVELTFFRAKYLEVQSQEKPVNYYQAPFVTQVLCGFYPFETQIQC